MIQRNPQRVRALLRLLAVSRNLERIADCATNIAEDVVYMVEGRIVRHGMDDF
jgi:phosphate transport system protein